MRKTETDNNSMDAFFIERLLKDIYSYELFNQVTPLVKFALLAAKEHPFSDDASPFSLEAIRKAIGATCPNCGSKDITREEGDDLCVCKACDTHFYETAIPYNLEWWHVGDSLAGDLKSLNEPILTDGCSYYWGRSTTDTPIGKDKVIRLVALDRADQFQEKLEKEKQNGKRKRAK